MARANDAKAKQKRQKIILGAGTVLLLIVLAVQLPKMLKLFGHGSSSAPAAAATTTGTTTTPGTTGTTSGTTPGTSGAAASGPAQSTALRNSDPTIPRSVDKLVAFTRFTSKDPFKQQVSDQPAGASGSSPPAPSVSNPAKPAAQPPVFGTVQGPGKSSKGGSGGTTAKLPGVRMSINGKPARVSLGKTFPASNPVFRVAGLAPGSVEIAVVGGSLADGSTTMTLRRKHPVTLVNTVDGVQYKLEFLATASASS